jgi:hypothetical protein
MSTKSTEGSGDRLIKWVNFTRPIVGCIFTLLFVLVMQYLNIQTRLILLESETKHIREIITEIKRDVQSSRRRDFYQD